MRSFKQLKKVIILTMGTCCIFGATVFASEAQEARSATIDLGNSVNAENVDARVQFLQTASAASVIKYDLRNRIDIPVYNQGRSNVCWGFSLATVYETTLKTLKNDENPISVKHLVYSTSDSFLNGEKYKYGLRRDAVTRGATGLMGLAYFTNGTGPISTYEMPFSDVQENIPLSEVTEKEGTERVTGWKFFGNIQKKYTTSGVQYKYEQQDVNFDAIQSVRNEIKAHIINYGAIMTTIKFDQSDNSQYFNPSTNSLYYNGTAGGDHSVSIIGWDDNYSKDNFVSTNKPANNGAYLIQNTWGDIKTYVYISYDDVNVEQFCYGITGIGYKDYYNLYQYDGQGANIGETTTENTYYVASVYDRNTTGLEILDEVGLTSLYDANYEIYINPVDGSLTGPNVQKAKVSTSPMGKGYITVKLDTPKILTGSKFAVIIKYTKVGDKKFGKTLLSGKSSFIEYSVLQSQAGQCYIGSAMESMTDMATFEKTTKACIKAFTKTLADKYDMSDKDKVKINSKDQKTSNNCWTMPISTVLETNRALNNNDPSALSAKHMDYFTSQSFTDVALNQFGFDRAVNTPGTAEWGLAYFTNGSGPVLEASMPFSDVFNDMSFSELTNKTVIAKVEDWVMFPRVFKEITDSGVKYLKDTGQEYTTSEISGIRDKIKLHLMNYGAIATETYIEGADKYYNPNTDAYYCDDETINRDHGLAIIGWDDNYPKENFNSEHQPEHNGAYIVQNSYGQNNEISQKYYVSYDDPNIERSMYGIVKSVDKDVAKEVIYQYDELGRNSSFTVSKNEAYGANVFSRDSAKFEYLKEISVSTYGDMNYEVYVNPGDGTISTEKMTLVAKSYDSIGNGYHTIKFAEPIKLTGTKFAVAVKYIGKDGKTMLTTQSKLTYTDGTTSPYEEITSNSGESYVGLSLDSMEDMKNVGTLPEGNLCIKAFTEDENGTYSPLKGDVNLDGHLTATDLSLMKLHLVELRILRGYQFTAGDMNDDLYVSATDLSSVGRKIIGL